MEVVYYLVNPPSYYSVNMPSNGQRFRARSSERKNVVQNSGRK